MTVWAPSLQRTEGALVLRFAARNGVTTAAETFQSGALRVRFPRASQAARPEAVILNTAGGVTGGDVLRARFVLDAGAQADICSQACEKIYKSVQGEARIRTEISLSPRASLDYLPQPTILFDRARLDRDTTMTIAPDSRLLALEAGILGRTAMGEVFAAGSLKDVWQLKRDGRLIFADVLALAGDRMSALRSPWALDCARAYATLIYAAPDAEGRCEEMRALLAGIGGKGAASAWDRLLVTRFLAEDGYQLIRDLTYVLTGFRRGALPRQWTI